MVAQKNEPHQRQGIGLWTEEQRVEIPLEGEGDVHETDPTRIELKRIQTDWDKGSKVVLLYPVLQDVIFGSKMGTLG